MAGIRTLAPLVPRSSGLTVRPEPKTVDPHYLTEEHRAWREQVLRKANYRCEWVENGQRCTKAAPRHRMFANHVKERRDGGAPFDPANGNCLCGAHHTRWTMQQRARRAHRGGG
ncbi:HNH endonuclease [Bradyrhizobium elkanii]|nr:HNH endonuclease [Bradyrhizobium elkanii]ODM79063.1 HNH endonuclease [Bradyrhizobium elkanii]